MLVIPMWLELAYHSRSPVTGTEYKPSISYYYSPVTKRWWTMQNGVVKQPRFDGIQIDKYADIIEAEKKIREEDESLVGYDGRPEIIYHDVNMKNRCLGYRLWWCGYSKLDLPKTPNLPWKYAYYVYTWRKTVYGHHRIPGTIIQKAKTEKGFCLSGLTTDHWGDLTWTAIDGVVEDSDSYTFPVYGLTVTSWQIHRNDYLTKIPPHPFSYRVSRVLNGYSGVTGAQDDVDTDTWTQQAIDLLSDPPGGHITTMLSEQF